MASRHGSLNSLFQLALHLNPTPQMKVRKGLAILGFLVLRLIRVQVRVKVVGLRFTVCSL